MLHQVQWFRERQPFQVWGSLRQDLLLLFPVLQQTGQGATVTVVVEAVVTAEASLLHLN